MGVFAHPPQNTVYEFEKGDPDGVGVAALQVALTERGFTVAVDGNFGDATDAAVRQFQAARGLFVDGVAGLKTQTKLADEFGRLAKKNNGLPSGLIYGLIESESNFRIAAVNWSVSGGVDCGYTQRRVYGPPWTESQVAAAFDSQVQIDKFAKDCKEQYLKFADASRYPAVQSKPVPAEYAWRLACLWHNWPYAADRLAKGYQLSAVAPSNPWWPSAVRFENGVQVKTYRDWAAYYAMGSRVNNHRGNVCRFAFQVPMYDYG
jgi:peptidoglycan hydrolase-like protein with peptidoglycan-binding domain